MQSIIAIASATEEKTVPVTFSGDNNCTSLSFHD
jgi:hypothetical protein